MSPPSHTTGIKLPSFGFASIGLLVEALSNGALLVGALSIGALSIGALVGCGSESVSDGARDDVPSQSPVAMPAVLFV